MANQLQASIYGADQNDWNKKMGVLRGFPTAGITIEPLTTPAPYSGVICNSIITLLPTGLRVNGIQFYTPALPDALITASNA